MPTPTTTETEADTYSFCDEARADINCGTGGVYACADCIAEAEVSR